MKVCLVTPFPASFRGGVEKFTYSLKENLTRKKIQAEVISLSDTELKFIPKSARFTISLLLLKKLLSRRDEFDIIHANAWSSFILKFLADKPTIATAHGTTYGLLNGMKGMVPFHSNFYSSLVTKNLERVGFKHAKKVVAVSGLTKKELINAYKINKDNISVIYNGIDINKFKKIKTDLRGNFNCEHLLFFIGRLTKQKGAEFLIKAISILKGYDINLVIAGEGPEKDDLIRLTKKLNLQDKVKFIGNVGDAKKIEFYSASDIFVFPSLWESFGIVLLEAMACKLPIVTTNAASIPEIVGDCGIITKAMDPISLASGIEQLFSDKKLGERLEDKAYKRLRDKFTTEKMSEDYIKIYKQII